MPIQLQQVRRIEFNDEEIGMGFNSESGLAIGSALEGFAIQENPVSSGQEVFATVSIVNSHEELMKSMGMSFEAQGRYGFTSASAKAQFSESSNYNSTSTFLVARCIVQNSLTRGKNFSVKSSAQALLDALRFDEFKRAFGDSFVRGLQTGGEYYCVIRITSVSSTQQNDLSVSLQAEYNGLAASGSFKGQYSEANKSTSTKSEYTATMYQKAGSGAQISPTVEISEAITRFKNFPEIVKTNPVAYETEIATYDTLPLPIPTPEEQEDFIFALRDAREQKLRYIQTKNDLEFALRNPTFFEALPANDVLSNAINVYTKLINAVMDHAIRLSRGQIKPPRIFDPSEVSPPIIEPAPIPLQRASHALEGEAINIDMTLDGVLLAGEWRSAADLAQMSTEDKRNTLIVEMSNHTRIPEPHYFQGFDTETLIGKAAILVFLIKAGIRDIPSLKGMSDDDQRNTLIVENGGHTQYTGGALQGMNNRELVQVGLGWFRK